MLTTEAYEGKKGVLSYFNFTVTLKLHLKILKHINQGQGKMQTSTRYVSIIFTFRVCGS